MGPLLVSTEICKLELQVVGIRKMHQLNITDRRNNNLSVAFA